MTDGAKRERKEERGDDHWVSTSFVISGGQRKRSGSCPEMPRLTCISVGRSSKTPRRISRHGRWARKWGPGRAGESDRHAYARPASGRSRGGAPRQSDRASAKARGENRRSPQRRSARDVRSWAEPRPLVARDENVRPRDVEHLPASPRSISPNSLAHAAQRACRAIACRDCQARKTRRGDLAGGPVSPEARPSSVRRQGCPRHRYQAALQRVGLIDDLLEIRLPDPSRKVKVREVHDRQPFERRRESRQNQGLFLYVQPEHIVSGNPIKPRREGAADGLLPKQLRDIDNGRVIRPQGRWVRPAHPAQPGQRGSQRCQPTQSDVGHETRGEKHPTDHCASRVGSMTSSDSTSSGTPRGPPSAARPAATAADAEWPMHAAD